MKDDISSLQSNNLNLKHELKCIKDERQTIEKENHKKDLLINSKSREFGELQAILESKDKEVSEFKSNKSEVSDEELKHELTNCKEDFVLL